MLRRTNTLFYTPDDLRQGGQKENNLKSIEKSSTHSMKRRKLGKGALYQFLGALERKVVSEKLGSIKITLIGHTMGAIVVNKIISLDFNLPYKKIIHLASADSINNIFDKIHYVYGA